MLTLTLKNVSEELHAFLMESAAKNRRSLNSEIMARLEREASVPTVDQTKLARDLKGFTSRCRSWTIESATGKSGRV